MCGAVLMIAATAAGAWLAMQGRHDLARQIDIPLHLLGGGLAALGFVWAVVRTRGVEELRGLPYGLRVLLVLGFVALVTIGWEFFERGVDAVFRTALQTSVIETLKDMAVGLLGALPVALWVIKEPL